MKLHYYSVLLISFFACQSGSQTIETPSEQATEIDTYSDTSETLDLTDEIIKLPEIDLNKNYIADILRLGRIESIDSLDLDSEWWGLFDKGEGKWRLEKTKIQSIAVHNPMVDEEGEMSSFEITTSKKEAYLLLWSNLDFLAERDVEQIKIEKNEIYPGEDIEFQFHRADYRIYAFGEDGEFGDIKNYELRISKNAGQHEPDQLITDHQYFDGTMLSILFVGDIDGDKIPDMIIEDSHKYSYSKPVLFLSRPTSESRIFIKIGERSFYSC